MRRDLRRRQKEGRGESPRARERLGGALGQVLDLPLLRCAALGNGWSDVPLTAEDVRWRKVTPKFCLTGGFSAVALWYGYYLQTTLKIPVGLLGAYVGATDIETWIPDCTLPPPPGREGTNGQKPSQYHNGKVSPVVPYALRGAIWYQGESNTASLDVIAGYGARMKALLDGNEAVRVVRYGKGRLVFWQVPPWQIDAERKPYLRTSKRHAEFMLSRLMGNLGFRRTVERVLYADVPIPDDDPYRYYHW